MNRGGFRGRVRQGGSPLVTPPTGGSMPSLRGRGGHDHSHSGRGGRGFDQHSPRGGGNFRGRGRGRGDFDRGRGRGGFDRGRGRGGRNFSQGDGNFQRGRGNRGGNFRGGGRGGRGNFTGGNSNQFDGYQKQAGQFQQDEHWYGNQTTDRGYGAYNENNYGQADQGNYDQYTQSGHTMQVGHESYNEYSSGPPPPPAPEWAEWELNKILDFEIKTKMKSMSEDVRFRGMVEAQQRHEWDQRLSQLKTEKIEKEEFEAKKKRELERKQMESQKQAGGYADLKDNDRLKNFNFKNFALYTEQELKTKMELLKEEKDKCEKEYRTWQDSCEKWKTAHADHPNKQLFDKYISEWKETDQKLQYGQQIRDQKIQKIEDEIFKRQAESDRPPSPPPFVRQMTHEVDSYHMTPPPQSHSRMMHQPTGPGYDSSNQMAHNTAYGSSGHRGGSHIPSGYGPPPSYTSPPPSINTHHGQAHSSNRNHSPSSNPSSFSPASVNRRPLYNDYSKNQSLASPENKSTGHSNGAKPLPDIDFNLLKSVVSKVSSVEPEEKPSGPKPNLLETNPEKSKAGFGQPARSRRDIYPVQKDEPTSTIDLSTFEPYDYGGKKPIESIAPPMNGPPPGMMPPFGLPPPGTLPGAPPMGFMPPGYPTPPIISNAPPIQQPPPDRSPPARRNSTRSPEARSVPRNTSKQPPEYPAERKVIDYSDRRDPTGIENQDSKRARVVDYNEGGRPREREPSRDRRSRDDRSRSRDRDKDRRRSSRSDRDRRKDSRERDRSSGDRRGSERSREKSRSKERRSSSSSYNRGSRR